MFDALAIDLGGVLFSAGKEYAKKEWIEHGYDAELIHSLLTSPPSMDLRKGIIQDHEFWDIFFKSKVPESYDIDFIKQAFYRGYLLDDDIVALMRRLKGKVRLVAFSGNIPSRIEYLDKQFQFRKLFDSEVYSFDCGATKPDIYFIEYLIKHIYPAETANVVLHHGTPLTGESHQLFKSLGKKILYLDDSVKDAAPSKEYDINTFIYARGHIDKLYEKYPELKE
ncbi:hypothetical protein CYY_002640 [Polysphondylium violaceum]|uniref:Uncharacterized protein n=1 Tax=Polysphondylium violaceum TaxID=133409 RepID=A0A8J4Q7P9_9MYCE|nr:hypothetical protein CYY_002640 [Polysphondylium violaceum]